MQDERHRRSRASGVVITSLYSAVWAVDDYIGHLRSSSSPT